MVDTGSTVGIGDALLSQSGGQDLLRSPDIRTSLASALLLQAYEYAQQLNREAWDFAVEISELRRSGLNNNDLRWLICNDLAQHAQESTNGRSQSRIFHSHGQLTFSENSCFILTERGLAHAKSIRTEDAKSHEPSDPQLADELNGHAAGQGVVRCPHPRWDSDRRELRYNGMLIKHFRVPSPNQEAILMAFQEEGWVPRIDDPLPYHPNLDSKRRLHDTIRSLNRHQREHQIRFKGDGTGEGILWDMVVDQTDR